MILDSAQVRWVDFAACCELRFYVPLRCVLLRRRDNAQYLQMARYILRLI